MYLKYKHLTKNDDDRLKSTSFYKLCNILSTNDVVMLSSIDYISGLLVKHSMSMYHKATE